MTEDQDIRAARDAIGRRLAAQFDVKRDLPDRLQALMRELKRQDEHVERTARGDR
jgi:hypothetical protein